MGILFRYTTLSKRSEGVALGDEKHSGMPALDSASRMLMTNTVLESESVPLEQYFNTGRNPLETLGVCDALRSVSPPSRECGGG